MRKIVYGLAGAFFGLFAYDSIDEALRNGISNGDITFYGSYTHGPKSTTLAKSDFNNSGYAVGSVGLAYQSAYWKYLRVAVSFRAVGVMYEDSKISQWGGNALTNNPGRYGQGDASKDFYMNDRTMLGQSFVEYFDGVTRVKLGRVFAGSEWADRLIDGVMVRNQSLPNVTIDALWAKRNGYVQYNKMTGFYDVNPYSNLGYSQLAFSYNLGSMMSFKFYGIANPEVHYATGVKLTLRYETSKSYLGASGHFATSFEQQHGVSKGQNGNGYNTDITLFVGVKDMVEASAGYINTGSSIGWGSMGMLGNTISPFFMWGGRALLERADVDLWYGKVIFNIDRVGFAVVYGGTRFRPILNLDGGQRSADSVNEVNLLVDFGFTEHVSAILNILNTHGGSQMYYPHMTNVNLGMKLAF